MSGSVKGWCPGALRPMESGDGYLLRLRPFRGGLSSTQTTGLMALARTYDIATFGLSNRANLQLRGIAGAVLPDLQRDLSDLGLIDADPLTEGRRNILISPFSNSGDLACILHGLLIARLSQMPDLPAKFGFAIDTGPFPCLQNDPADLRFELASEGLILRADGMEQGELQPDLASAVQRAMQIATWFATARQHMGARRMRHVLADGHPCPLRPDTAPILQSNPLHGPQSSRLVYAPFGEISYEAFAEIAGCPLRLTPWRAVLLPESAAAYSLSDHWLTDPDHPLLRMAACPGSPQCASASVKTRDLARSLAHNLPSGLRLHVSGCAKGCAHPQSARLTLCGRGGRFDLISNGKAGDSPVLTDLLPDQLSHILRGYLASHL